MTSEILITFLEGLVFPILSALILALIPILTYKINKWLTEKTGVEANINLDIIAQRAVAYVEEIALTKAKNVDKFTSNDKLNEAIKFIMVHCPKVTQEQAKQLVLASLNKLKIGASGKK